MYCICNKISIKDILSLINDYNYTIEELQDKNIACNRCEICIPLILKEVRKQIILNRNK